MNLGNLKLVVLSIAIASLTACGGGGGSSSTGSTSSNPTSSSSPSISNGDSSNSDSGDSVVDVEDPDEVDPDPVENLQITAQPSAQTLASDESMSLSVSVDSSSAYSVAWYKDGSLISNANTYQDNSLTASDSGSYSCVVTMGGLTDQCSNFSITVIEIPGITASPSNQIVTEGEALTLAVSAQGSNLTYQWYLDGSLLDGETSNQLSVSEVALNQAGDYVCIVSNSVGSDTSAAASVSVIAATQYADAEISWARPDTRSDGSDLAENEIGAYKVYYGPADEDGFADNVQVSSDSLSVVLEDLEFGQYKFAVSTVDTDGAEGDLSDEFLLAVQ